MEFVTTLLSFRLAAIQFYELYALFLQATVHFILHWATSVFFV